MLFLALGFSTPSARATRATVTTPARTASSQPCHVHGRARVRVMSFDRPRSRRPVGPVGRPRSRRGRRPKGAWWRRRSKRVSRTQPVKLCRSLQNSTTARRPLTKAEAGAEAEAEAGAGAEAEAEAGAGAEAARLTIQAESDRASYDEHVACTTTKRDD